MPVNLKDIDERSRVRLGQLEEGPAGAEGVVLSIHNGVVTVLVDEKIDEDDDRIREVDAWHIAEILTTPDPWLLTVTVQVTMDPRQMAFFTTNGRPHAETMMRIIGKLNNRDFESDVFP